jgi:hypothetical protein
MTVIRIVYELNHFRRTPTTIAVPHEIVLLVTNTKSKILRINHEKVTRR